MNTTIYHSYIIRENGLDFWCITVECRVHTSSAGGSNLLTLKVEGRLWLLPQQPPIETQSVDVDPPSEWRCEAMQATSNHPVF